MKIDLEQARTRAKELLRSGRAEKLADAQREIARELGYPSWPALVHALEPPTVERVVAEAHERPDLALELVERLPALRDDPWVALTLGDTSGTVDATTPGGPLNAAPLFYVARSRIARETVAAARDLLARGADPNGKTADREGGPISRSRARAAMQSSCGHCWTRARTRTTTTRSTTPSSRATRQRCACCSTMTSR